jgi:hypothetical protein
MMQTPPTLFPYHKQAFTIDGMKTKCVCFKNMPCCFVGRRLPGQKTVIAVKAQLLQPPCATVTQFYSCSVTVPLVWCFMVY